MKKTLNRIVKTSVYDSKTSVYSCESSMLMIFKALFMVVNFLFMTEKDSEYDCKSFVNH